MWPPEVTIIFRYHKNFNDREADMTISQCFCLCFLVSSCVAQKSKGDINNGGALTQDGRRLSVLLATGFWPGHLYPITALGEELVKRGHNVTLCATVMEGSNLLPDLPESYGINFVSAGSDNLTQKSYDDAMNGLHSFNGSSMTVITNAPSLTSFKVRTKVTEIVEKFDILVSDLSIVPVGVYHAKVGIKSVIFSPIMPYVLATLPSWPAPLNLGWSIHGDDLTFMERLVGSLVPHSLMIKAAFSRTANIDKECGRVTNVHDYYNYPGTRIPLICNSVLGFDSPKTYMPLTHYVGPVLFSSTPPLEKPLKEWLDTKEHRSVIYVGMGSTGAMSKGNVRAFVDGILATRFDAVWRLSLDEQRMLEAMNINTGSNRLYISKWVPRQTLFKHQAMVLSFLHCGLNGVQESLSNGLPVVCAPNFFDHFEVGMRIFATNVGIPLYSFMDSIMGRNQLTAEVISNAIKMVAENSTYHVQAEKMQKIFKFAGGSKRAADLVEFYAEVGYDHLVPAFAKYEWSWVQYYNIDVYCLLSLPVCLIMCCLFGLTACKCCCKFCCSPRKQKND